jgi:pyrimidine-nucleoside phosphorylase
VGNAAEVAEAVEVLLQRGPGDVRELSLRLAASMVHLGGRAGSQDEGRRLAESALETGRAYDKFQEMVRAQGGDLDRFNSLAAGGGHLAGEARVIRAPKGGFVTRCDARAAGEGLRILGGGRLTRKDVVDPGAALEVLKKAGDPVSEDEPLARVFFSCHEGRWDEARPLLEGAFEIGEETLPPTLVIGSVGPRKRRDGA